MFSFVTLRRNARLQILLLYVFIIIKKNGFFYLFMFSKPVIMLKATSHANPKEKHALGACSRGRAFLFGFIRRQPYMKQALQCLRMGMA